jgi:arylsulfatase A-like enzyme
MYDDTLIVVTSDHGEMLGDYRVVGKRTMFNGACHIPMLVRVPGMEPSVRNDPCSLVDLAPTILSWAGIDYDPAEFDGVDLLKEEHTEVYSQYDSGEKGVYMVCDECDKLIYNAKEKMYYYLKDHDETVNKYKACQDDEKVLELKEKLDAYVASDRGSASPRAVQVADQPFGAGCKDNRHTIMQEFDRVPDEYKLKLGSGGPAKTRVKYLKAQENKKKQ